MIIFSYIEIVSYTYKTMKVGITLLKKLKKQKKKDYNWVGKYIKEYNERVLYYEKQLAEKNKIIDYLKIENDSLRKNIKFQGKQKQISDKDIDRIRKLKNEGKSYSYISNVTGWSKATISRVINNKKNIY